MPRVVGVDPGTVSIDLCGLDDGRVVLDRSWPTAEALHDAFCSAVGEARGRNGSTTAGRSDVAATTAEGDFSPPDPASLPEDARAFRALIAPAEGRPLAASA